MTENTMPWYAFYDGVRPHLNYPEGSVYDLLEASAAKYENNISHEYYGTKCTYKEFLKKIEQTFVYGSHNHTGRRRMFREGESAAPSIRATGFHKVVSWVPTCVATQVGALRPVQAKKTLPPPKKYNSAETERQNREFSPFQRPAFHP